MDAEGSSLGRQVNEFLDSMPAAYARAFTVREVEQHAGIVARRGSQIAQVERCPGVNGQSSVCVVADDQPGLLSFVSDALLVHGLNVAHAKVFCRRRRDDLLEAVDFFWLDSTDEDTERDGLDEAVIESVAQTLRELIAENQITSHPPKERDTIPVPRPHPTRIYFDLDAIRQGELVLVIDMPDFSGLLFAATSALHGQGMRIEASEIHTEAGIARDRFYLSTAGGVLPTAERLCDVQQAVQAAVLAARG